LTRHAALGTTSVPEGLNPMERVADGISVVPVWIEGVAREEGFAPLESPAIGRNPDPVPGHAARSFKTLRRAFVHKGRLSLLSQKHEPLPDKKEARGGRDAWLRSGRICARW